MKYRINQVVRVIDKELREYGYVGKISAVNEAFPSIKPDYRRVSWYKEHQLEAVSPYVAGDIVVDKDGRERKVLAVNEGLVGLSEYDDHTAYIYTQTHSEMEQYYKPKTTQPTIEIAGKHYNADEVAERVKELKEVE